MMSAVILLAPFFSISSPAESDPGIRQTDIPYVADGHTRQVLDIYVPSGDGPFPLVIWIHGGGWASGDKSGCPPLRAGFLDHGYAIASINYRLSGDAIWPAQIEDCKAAVRWVRTHASDYRINPGSIAVWGSSAGGHLVAMLGTSDTTAGFDTGVNLDKSSRVQAVIDYYGPTDFIQMDQHAVEGARLKHDDPRSPESRLIGGPIQNPENAPKVQSANPVNYVTSDDPPFLIVHGDEDPLVPHHQSEILYAALEAAKVPVHFITINGGGHGKGFPARELNPICLEFLDRNLKGTSAELEPPTATQSALPAEATATEGTNVRSGKPSVQPVASQRKLPSWKQILKREDANGDGKVSRSEFHGPARLFERLDANGDGVLTGEEHDAFAKPSASH